MIAPPPGVRILIATRPVDFRKGADGLASLAMETLGQNPFSGTVLVFRGKRADRIGDSDLIRPRIPINNRPAFRH
jgi:transposase